jgi:hypothetical protein
MVKMERNMEAQNKRLAKSEKVLEDLKVSQSRLEKAVQLVNQKVEAIAGDGILPTNGAAMLDISAIPVSATASVAPSDVGGCDEEEPPAVYKPVKDGKRMTTLKTKLKEERLSQRPVIEHSNSMESLESLDSRGLVDDYMLDKMNIIDSTIKDDLAVKVLELEFNNERLQNTVKALQDAVKDLEKAAEDAKDHPVVVEYDHASHVRKYFKGVTYEAKDGWERVFEELDKKVARMEYLTAQNGEKPDEYALRLIEFRKMMEKALVDIDSGLTAMKEAEANSAPDVKEAVLASLSPVLEGLMHVSGSIGDLEATYKQNYDKKTPGQAIPISQMPSKLSDLITSANKKSTNFLDQGISQVALKKRMGEMQEAIDDKVCVANFHKFNDDMHIALTLKADNKALDAVNIKKASCLELQKFREHVADEIDSMRELLVKNAASASKMLASVTSSRGDDGELAQRFDLLYGQFQEMQRGVSSFVPRSEIEIALQALLDEVKSVQRSTVDKDVLFEKLKKKADRGDVDRWVGVLVV